MFKLFLLSFLVLPHLKAEPLSPLTSIVSGKQSDVAKNPVNGKQHLEGKNPARAATQDTKTAAIGIASPVGHTATTTVSGAMTFLRDSSLRNRPDDTHEHEHGNDPITQCSNSFLDSIQPCEGNSSPVVTKFQTILQAVDINNKANLNTAFYSDSYCACINRKVREEQYLVISENEVQAKLKEEQDKLNDMILTAVGVKFLNSYAGNMEDVQFFITTNVSVFGEDVEASRGLQCNKASDYEAEVEAVCSENNVSREESERRISHIMNSLGDNQTGQNLTERFSRLEHDVLNIKVKSPGNKKSGDAGSMVTREMFDKLRYSASQESPEVDFLDQFAYEVLNDRKLKAQLDEQLANGRSPGHAIITILKDKDQNKNFLNNYFEKNKRNESVARLKDLYNNEELFTKELLDIYKVAIDYHPGIKAMFRDADLFKKIKPITINSRLGSRPSLVQGMDKSPEILNEHFRQRCQDIKTRFAQAVCAPSNNFLSFTSRDDLNNLLKGKQEGSFNPVFKDLLLCENRKPTPVFAEAKVFQELEFHKGDDINRSEYYDRKRNLTTSFAAYATAMSNNSNIELREELTSLTAKHVDKIRPTFRPEQSYGSKAYEGVKESLLTEVSSNTSSKIADRHKQPEESHSLSSASIEPAFHAASSTLAPATAALTIPTSQQKEKSSSDENKIREQIKEYLGSNYKEVDQHLSNTKDTDLTELMKLKEELAKDRQKIAELMREADQQKIKSLETTFKQLETRYNDAIKSKEAERTRIDRTHQSGDFSNTSLGEYKANINDSKAQTQAAVETNTRSPASVQAASLASGGARAANASSAMTDRSAPASSAAKDSYRGDIIVTSSEVQSGSPKDPSQELIKYVTQNQLDVQTLLQLKESGLTYKYRTVENGREVEKEMKIDYASLTPEAKAVLEKQIASSEAEKQKELDRLEKDYIAARRAYSFSTLKMILGIEAQRQSVAN